MNKRMFLKLSAAILGGSSGARLFGRATDEPASGGKLTNWAGNYRYSTDNLHRLTSIEQVRKFVKEHDSLKVLGTRHCFNGIADSTHASHLPQAHGSGGRARPGGAHGDGRSGDELRPVVPLSPRRGALHCTTSPRCLTFPSPAPVPPRPMDRASRMETWRRRSRPWNSSRPAGTS